MWPFGKKKKKPEHGTGRRCACGWYLPATATVDFCGAKIWTNDPREVDKIALTIECPYCGNVVRSDKLTFELEAAGPGGGPRPSGDN